MDAICLDRFLIFPSIVGFNDSFNGIRVPILPNPGEYSQGQDVFFKWIEGGLISGSPQSTLGLSGVPPP
jgi:hypothetical protein